ncbi:MAG: hypothetical protein WC343_04815 [Bacilli bacterium]|jgi:nucleoside recognition membrane protein YjiH
MKKWMWIVLVVVIVIAIIIVISSVSKSNKYKKELEEKEKENANNGISGAGGGAAPKSNIWQLISGITDLIGSSSSAGLFNKDKLGPCPEGQYRDPADGACRPE